MAQKTQRLSPDIVLKNYWNDNTRFADLFNAVLFEGRQVITPDDLADIDTEESSISEHRGYAESIKAARDIIKIQKMSDTYGVHFVMLGLEDQERIHYAMPMRVMGYDYGTYKKQYDSNAAERRHTDGMNADEYLSGMKRTDKFAPVITIVIYYGEKPWDGATTLHEMLDIPAEMRPFINDYKMLLVEARQNRLAFHNVNNRDLFHMLSVILDRNMPGDEAREKVIKYAEEHDVGKTVVLTIAGATGCKIDYNAFEKGDGDMCTLFDEIAKESEAKGKIEGIIETGLDLGLSKDDILQRLQSKLNISMQTAVEYLDKFAGQTV